MSNFLFFSTLASLFQPRCHTATGEAVARGAEMIRSGEAECVLIKEGKTIPRKRGHGVSSLLDLYDGAPAGMAGGIVVDKVIGRAAAAIMICGKAKHAHGLVMSEDALSFLQDHGVTGSYDTLVPRILNRDRSGLCPLEKLLEGIEDPATALVALRTRIAVSPGRKQEVPGAKK